MRKGFLLVFAAIALASIFMAAKGQPTGSEHGREAQGAAPAASVSAYRPSTNDADSTKKYSKGWDKFVTWPEGIATWALILTLAAIVWQAIETRRSANAAKLAAEGAEKNTDVLINAERAWLAATVENFQAGGHLIHIAVPIENAGRTVAKVRRIDVTRSIVPFPENSWGRPGALPNDPVYDETYTTTIEERNFIIPPGGIHRAYVWIFSDDYTRMRERKVSLYVYGVVTYLDTVRGEDHRTCFCEIYHVPEQGANPNEKEGFLFSPNLIPSSYICAT